MVGASEISLIGSSVLYVSNAIMSVLMLVLAAAMSPVSARAACPADFPSFWRSFVRSPPFTERHVRSSVITTKLVGGDPEPRRVQAIVSATDLPKPVVRLPRPAAIKVVSTLGGGRE
jgi:hypothetical protein